MKKTSQHQTRIITPVIIILFFLTGFLLSAQGYLHRQGELIVDGNGKNVLLRGLGLGGWMVQEGYMLQTSDFAGPQHVIRQKVQELIGPQNTEEFYASYLANGITKRDIDSLAAWGFNSIRLPMHYNLYTPPIEEEKEGAITFMEKGFQMTDDLLKWCAANKMYLILDLHAAPGGQGKDANISDYDETKPSLWESEANKKKIIAFWAELARRYKDEPWIGGYDIINEPNWNFTGTNINGCDENSNAPLRELMVDITKAIREVDKNHLVIIEGNCWGNNYNGIFPLWDENMALSFHKYWNYNNTEAIQKFLDLRKELNVPVWLGESGENSNVWFRDVIALVEANNIGWAFWPMKKVENIAGVTSVTKNPEYETLLKYWKTGGERPTPEFAKKALMQLAENYKMEHVTIKPDVIDAMFRQVQSNETLPYKKHTLPGRIYASEYDLGTQGFAYSDTGVANYWVSDGTRADWNNGKVMRNDGVDLQVCKDTVTNGYEVFDIADKEWLLFTAEVKKPGKYDLVIRYAGETEGSLHLEQGGESLTQIIKLPPAGGKTNYKSVVLEDIPLKAAVKKIKVVFEKGGFSLNYLEFIEAN
jgi:hypothetical protein